LRGPVTTAAVAVAGGATRLNHVCASPPARRFRDAQSGLNPCCAGRAKQRKRTNPWRATWLECHNVPDPVRGCTRSIPVTCPSAHPFARPSLDTCGGHDLRNRDPGYVTELRNESHAEIGSCGEYPRPPRLDRSNYQLAGANRSGAETRGDEPLEFRARKPK